MAADTAMQASATTQVPGTVRTALPETIMRRRRHIQELTKKAQREKKTKAALQVAKRKLAFKRAEAYVKEYRRAESERIRMRRAARHSNKLYVDPEPRLAFVIRIKGINKIPPKPRKILQLLRLRQINNGVFVRLTKPTKQMLKLVEPYIAYGEPNLKTVRELLYKRGYAKYEGRRVPLSDNAVIEQALGKHGLICMEDLIYEIYKVGPNFKYVNRFLWPFKLSSPTGAFARRKFRHFVEGGDCGDREQFINELVRRMC